MLDLQEIENTITSLENGETTFANCERLAALYIVRERLSQPVDQTEKEIKDILPSYKLYAEVKEKYWKHELTEEAVISTLHSLCREIEELIHILYSNTEMETERKEIFDLVSSIYSGFLKN